MKKSTSFLFCCLISFSSFSQDSDLPVLDNTPLANQMNVILNDNKISADSAWLLLTRWNQYPIIKKPGKSYLYLYKDSIFGVVPIKIFIPNNYKESVPSKVILLLHGATVLSSFKDAYKLDTAFEKDIFYDYFATRNYIIIRPYADGHGPNADGKINFDWVVNRFNGKKNSNKINYTFETLTAIIKNLKEIINIDDNKIFALGHSDGADGAFALEIYQPSIFAGFIAYNSMLNQIFGYDIYLGNTQNRQLYIVHSDLDDLRPIQQTRDIIKILDSIKSPFLYKEYMGYQHEDSHLQKDVKNAYDWTNGIRRNSFQKALFLESCNYSNNACDWIKICEFDTTLKKAKWHNELNPKMYNKRDSIYYENSYYHLNKSAAVKASYNNNIFNIYTSRVKEIEILISPVMVNFENPIYVNVNEKQLFKGKLNSNKKYLLNTFKQNFDRQALWVTSINLKIE